MIYLLLESKVFCNKKTSILTNVKITDPRKAELFVNALEASSKDPKWVPTSEVKPPLTDKKAIRDLVLKGQADKR